MKTTKPRFVSIGIDRETHKRILKIKKDSGRPIFRIVRDLVLGEEATK